jgi:hypothetical protein
MLDDWIAFKVSPDLQSALLAVRGALESAFMQKVLNPEEQMSSELSSELDKTLEAAKIMTAE